MPKKVVLQISSHKIKMKNSLGSDLTVELYQVAPARLQLSIMLHPLFVQHDQNNEHSFVLSRFSLAHVLYLLTQVLICDLDHSTKLRGNRDVTALFLLALMLSIYNQWSYTENGFPSISSPSGPKAEVHQALTGRQK